MEKILQIFYKIPPEVANFLTIAAVVFFGAVVHATSQLKVARDAGKEFNKIDFIILVTIASFSGLVFGLAATLFFQNDVMIILSSAIGAFLGMAGLNRLANVILEVLTTRAKKPPYHD